MSNDLYNVLINFYRKNINLQNELIDVLSKQKITTVVEDNNLDEFTNQDMIWQRMQSARNILPEPTPVSINNSQTYITGNELPLPTPPIITNLHRYNSSERDIILYDLFKKASANVEAIIKINNNYVKDNVEKGKKIQEEADKLLDVFLKK